MNLHILKDEKFTDGAILQFENYFPDQNVFVINSKAEFCMYVKSKNIINLDFEKHNDINRLKKIVKRKEISHVFVHFLDYFSAGVANLIRSKNKSLIFNWVFFGGDLYSILNNKFSYPLFDTQIFPLNSSEKLKPVSRSNTLYFKIRNKLKYLFLFHKGGFENYKNFVKNLDYFCFWNIKDFELLKMYFDTSANFKYFHYTNSMSFEVTLTKSFYKTKILVNNSASPVGNHLTVLQKIESICNGTSCEVVIPLNYGSDTIKNGIKAYVEERCLRNVTCLLEYMAKDKYFEILNDISVGVFGGRRQYSAANILKLLANGAKVFLRNDNNLLSLFREWGFIIFSFEDDLNSCRDLVQLTAEQQAVNCDVFQNRFNQRNVNDFMHNLILPT